MSNKLYEENSIQNIANNLRFKNNSSATYKVIDMSEAILNFPFSNIPNYHYAEVGRVVKRILDLKEQYPNNICFGTISDNHVDMTSADSMKSAKHSAFALESVGVFAQCDFVANLGDNIVGTNIDSEYNNAVYMENCTRYGLTSQVGYSIVGNHDKSSSTQKLYDLMGKFNSFDNYGTTKIRGFGYKDYTDKKVRVICLNTCDYWNIQGGNGMSYEQKDFLMKALDLSAKTNYASWTIIILSHIPLDFLGGDYNKGNDLKTILKAYNNGTTATINVNNSYANAQNESDKFSGTLTYNYSGKNTPKIINIHGHIHTNKYGKLKFIDDNTELDIIRIATPNSSFYGNASTNRYTEYGDYSITTSEANKIKKIASTKADTSATFYFIDLDRQIVYCIGYGADIDRTVIYADATIYSISYVLTDVSSSNNLTNIIEGTSYTTTLSVAQDYTLGSVTVTMGGTNITSTAYSNGVVTISNVTGNIVITANAKDNYVPKWDIADRTAITNEYLLANATKELSRKIYYYGATPTGLIDYRKITDVSLSGNNVTFTASEKGYGIGVPYQLESGKTYTFTATSSVKGRLRKIFYNADGTFVSGSETYSSSGTNLTLTFTAPTDTTQWVMLLLDSYTASTSVTYSNITLTKTS